MSRKKDVNSQLKIMKVLAEHKEFEQFKMKNETGLTYKTIIQHLKTLTNYKVITFRTEPSKKGGKDKKIYRITFRGLWAILSELDLEGSEGKKKLEQIIQRFPEFLLFFKKWPLFVEAGIQNKMLDFFIPILRYSWIQYFDMVKLVFSRKRKHLKEFTEALDADISENLDSLILVGSLYVPEMKEVLKPIVLSDQELTSFVKKIIDATEEKLKQVEEIKTFMFV